VKTISPAIIAGDLFRYVTQHILIAEMTIPSVSVVRDTPHKYCYHPE
jgi:hypothetical protein